MSIGTFTLIRNEKMWIRPHIAAILPFIDEMVFYDGGSTDGTLEAIKSFQAGPDGHKIRLFENKDPKDLRDDYVALFNDCMRELSTDLAWFAHPDFFTVNPQQILAVKDSDAIAMTTRLISYAGEPNGQLFRIEEGRQENWKNIYRLRNPDLGARYHGWYGHGKEDVYFSEITGNEYVCHDRNFERYPYPVINSGLVVRHFSDVRTKERRYGRMLTCLINQGHDPVAAKEIALTHPRVTFENKDGFKFVPDVYPKEFLEANMEAVK